MKVVFGGTEILLPLLLREFSDATSAAECFA
jgi:hypothetical protein